MSYDSRPETNEHIRAVREFLGKVTYDLFSRSVDHDASKLVDPEKAMFDEFTPRLRELTYGSDEYKACTEAMGEGLQHHYAHNDHHPQHFAGGVDDMNLLQLIEMLADWKAATLRHEGGNLGLSIVHNQERFGMSDELTRLLHDTAEYLGWL